MKSFKVLSLLAVAVSIMLLATSADAQPTIVKLRTKVFANDHFDWGDHGAAFTVVPNGFTTTSEIRGSTAVVTHGGGGSFERRDQGSGWAGNFFPGEQLLWTRNVNGYLHLDLGPNVRAIGANIQRDLFGAFTATISVFNAAGGFLGSFNRAGNSTSAGDGSAIFLGAKDRANNNINQVRWDVDGGTVDFAINTVYFQHVVAGVPEPASMIALGTGLVGLAIRRRKRA